MRTISHRLTLQLFDIKQSFDERAPKESLPATSSSNVIRRLLVDPKSRKFLGVNGEWTAAEGEALTFRNNESVVRACSKYRLKNAELLLRSNNPHQEDLRIPLRFSM